MWIFDPEICLDIGGSGIDECAARAAGQNSIINLNVLFLTPLPRTGWCDLMKADGHIVLDNFLEGWSITH
jgi:hypothetical protein